LAFFIILKSASAAAAVNVFQPFGITRPHYALLIWPKFGWQLKKSANIILGQLWGHTIYLFL